MPIFSAGARLGPLPTWTGSTRAGGGMRGPRPRWLGGRAAHGALLYRQPTPSGVGMQVGTIGGPGSPQFRRVPSPCLAPSVAARADLAQVPIPTGVSQTSSPRRPQAVSRVVPAPPGGRSPGRPARHERPGQRRVGCVAYATNPTRLHIDGRVGDRPRRPRRPRTETGPGRRIRGAAPADRRTTSAAGLGRPMLSARARRCPLARRCSRHGTVDQVAQFGAACDPAGRP
jgi:hypothetical protein